MHGAPTETGLVIPILEIDDFVQRWRPLDAIPLSGVPAHVTVLYPWIPPPVAGADLDRLAHLVGRFEPFEFTLTDVRWFGTDVIYLAPEPPEPFAALTTAVARTWPEHPPYEGEIADPIPHVTLVHGGSIESMAHVGDEARQMLPIRCRATELWLMIGGWDPAVWSIDRRYRFGDGATTTA